MAVFANAGVPVLAGWCVAAFWRRRADIEQETVGDEPRLVQPTGSNRGQISQSRIRDVPECWI